MSNNQVCRHFLPFLTNISCLQRIMWVDGYAGYMGNSGNTDRQYNMCVFLGFADGKLTTSAGNLFQKRTARALNACWLRRACYRCCGTWIVNMEIRYPTIRRWIKENRRIHRRYASYMPKSFREPVKEY